MIEYPKIETLYNRDPAAFTVKADEFRLPEFGNVRTWLVTEKIDGTNIRVHFDGERVRFGGRTDRAQIPVPLLNVLSDLLTVERMAAALPNGGTLFGEGYGPKIQKGGGNYRGSPGFRLFDVRVGDWWLRWDDVRDVATKLSIHTAPALTRTLDGEDLPVSEAGLRNVLAHSLVARSEAGRDDIEPEGIVARSYPELLSRRGDRLMWKLKYSDFRAGKR